MKTLVVNRRNLLIGIGALLLLGAIFYYGWQYTAAVQASLASALGVSATETESGETKPAAKNPAAAASTKVTAPPAAPQTAADLTDMEEAIPVAAVGVRAKESASEFFAQFRMERDRVRGQQLELYREIVNNPQSAESMRSEAQQRLFTLTQDMEKELKSENLIVARGYAEAVVFLQPQGVTAVVLSPKFTEEQKRSVVNLISRTLGCKEEAVSVIAR